MRIVLLILFSFLFIAGYGNDSTSTGTPITGINGKFLHRINSKIAALNGGLDKQTEKYLLKLSRQEAKLKKKLYKLDSNATRNLFLSDPQQQYALYIKRMRTDTAFDKKAISGDYIPYADSLQGSLSFLNKNPQLLNDPKISPVELQNSVAGIQTFQAKMQDADQIKQFLRQRKDQIKAYLLQFAHVPPGITDMYQDYNKELYYYDEQIRSYKESLDDPDKLFKEALALLEKFPGFQDFMKDNSVLAGLFPAGNTFNPNASLSGLQTRDQLAQSVQSQLSGADPAAAFGPGAGEAQSQLDRLKDKLSSYGQSGGDVDMPNFKPNGERTKTFLQRLEFGVNMQSQQSTPYFPTTSDIGLSLGYKLNNRSTIGLGASYKIGWGTDISHISVSSQGAGLRSFIDIQMKGSFYATGGMEYNYQQPFYKLNAIYDLNSWQQSGLIGISKMVSTNAKMLKKTKIQLLWDFLSYQQIPRAQPFKFRIGYNF